MNDKRSKISLETINDLLNKNFFIPAYQRGYRWTERQVKELLEDIWNFSQKSNDDDAFYCLQPIVVKKCCKEMKINKDLSGDWYEVIDGQQRLTTIYIILNYFNQRLVDEFKNKLYSIEYETRPKSTSFLKDIDSGEYKKNVDFFHIYHAFKRIKKWFEDRQNIINDFEATILNNVKVIWYQIEADINSIDIFTRINIGKIPLTNAELIKALFLGKVKSNDNNDRRVRLKRLQIASEWDNMEYTLQDDSFWHFIYEGNVNYDTRIEYIFDLMKEKPKAAETYYTFHQFNDEFDEKDIDTIWLEIKRYFQTLKDWYNDREFYHYIGYLITAGNSVNELKCEADKKTKSKFKDFLINKIKTGLNLNLDLGLDNLEYGKNNEKIKELLLLFNIQTLLNNDKANSRFPFDLYKKENWEIEHIHSINEEMPKAKQHQKDWLKDAKQFINDNKIKKEVKKFIRKDKLENFEGVFNKVLSYFNKDEYYEEINDISNLALLDFKTNRGYGNAVFPVKRKTIIEKDKTGTFIPICTKNVFMKYYSNEVLQISFWSSSDSKNYLEAIKEVLAIFLPNREKKESANNE